MACTPENARRKDSSARRNTAAAASVVVVVQWQRDSQKFGQGYGLMRHVRHELEQRTERVLAFGEMLGLNFRLAQHWPPPAMNLELSRPLSWTFMASGTTARHARPTATIAASTPMIRPARPIFPAPRLASNHCWALAPRYVPNPASPSRPLTPNCGVDPNTASAVCELGAILPLKVP